MQNLNRQGLCRKRTGVCQGLIGLLIMLSIVAGCSAGRKTGPESVNETAREAGPTVTRFKDGREGFTINEPADRAVEWGGDFAQAVVMLEGKRYAQAIETMEQVVQRSPGVTAPYIDIAMAYRQVGKLEQAEKYLKTALELVPGHPVASNEYGLLLRRSGRFGEARQIYEEALTRFPEYLPIRKNLGILCDLYLKDQACALEQYRIYSEARPENEAIKLWIASLKLPSPAN